MVGKNATTVRLPSDDVGGHLVPHSIRAFAAALVVVFGSIGFPCVTHAQTVNQRQTIHETPLAVAGDQASRWSVGDADVTWMRGNCRVLHGDRAVHCDEALVVVDGPAGRLRCRVVMAGVRDSNGTLPDPIAVTIHTTIEPEVQAPGFLGAPQNPPAIWKDLPNQTPRDRVGPSQDVQQVQFQLNAPLSPGPTVVPPPSTQFPGDPIADPVPDGLTELPAVITGEDKLEFFVGGGNQSVTIETRSGVGSIPNETLDREALGETVVVARGGVTVKIRDVSAQLPDGQFLEFGTVSLSADRIVAWLPLLSDMLLGRRNISETQGELYLEGDIVFRQGDRVIYADSMYYNVTQQTGMVLDAEAITTAPNYDGIVRLKSDVLQQVAAGNFRAFNAAVTTSRLGVPRYWMQSEQLTLQDRPLVEVDRRTGLATQGTEPYVGSRNNFVYVGGVPVFYWPRFSAPLRKPPLYLTGADVRNDDIFGTQVMLEWDLFQLLGYDRAPEGFETKITTGYLSERGPAIGSQTNSTLPGIFGVPGDVRGAYDSYLIYDTGLDTLGRDRRDLPPEETWRGRSFWQHRGRTASGWEFIGQLGYLSDRNFLEQYFEEEWDQNSDHVTGLRVQRYAGSQLLDLSVQAQLNDFFKETERLPVLEHYALGLSPLGNALTWSMKNKVGYEKLNVADTPTNAAEIANFNLLPGEVAAEGLNASTKHEVTVPLDLGPFNVNPFFGGEASYFGEAADGDSLTRLIGQAGIRASLAMHRIDPTIQSSLLNIRGLAHKVEWVGEYFYADSDTNLDDLPYYDSLDDTAQEQFRRRLITDKFGGVLPSEFDPRTFGVRQGLQRYVTNPSDVIAADLSQIRLGVHQRFQTHRGLQGRDRIVDVFSLDLDTILFPDADRDNFGETLGPTTYDARYHLGDRVSLLSDGYIDFFDDGLRSISAGARMSRPGLGDVYVGLLSLEGPISSTVLRTTLDYRLNEKWIVSAASTYDLGDAGNVGQSFGVRKIGESFLAGVELNVDPGRDNVGIGVFLVPRFFPTSRGRIGGQMIPAAGAMGLE